MKLRLFAFGKVSKWIEDGIVEYLKRMPELSVEVIDGRPLNSRVERMFKTIGTRTFKIALDKTGIAWTSEDLAEQYGRWRTIGKDISFLIGDDQGFSKLDLNRVDQVWSLSNLTFPQAIARLVVCEQLYRATTIYHGHAYHRS